MLGDRTALRRTPASTRWWELLGLISEQHWTGALHNGRSAPAGAMRFVFGAAESCSRKSREIVMLRWRVLVSLLLIAVLIGLVWLDHRASWPGVWLFPLAVILLVLGTDELLGLLAGCGVRPVKLAVQAGNLLIITATWLPLAIWAQTTPGPGHLPVGSASEVPAACADAGGVMGRVVWPAAGLAVALGLVFLAEVLRYGPTGIPGTAAQNLAGGIFALVYLGAMFSLLVHLRMAFGMGALLSLVVVVKLGDTVAFAAGQLFGRHKLVPRLSPGKTCEGLAGQLLANAAASWITFTWVVPWTAPEIMPATPAGPVGPAAWRWLAFGLIVGLTGLLGDLAESLIKRSAQRKDSSTWLPGLGGLLDVLDSLLLATPAAWLCWAFGLVGSRAGAG